MRTPIVAVAAVLTTATAALAGGPRILGDTSNVVGAAALLTFVVVNLALYHWRSK